MIRKNTNFVQQREIFCWPSLTFSL